MKAPKEWWICKNPDATGLYPYTLVACQFGRRIYREYETASEVYYAMEEAYDLMLFSPTLIITPNSTVIDRDAFQTKCRSIMKAERDAK